jgi:hypothetical protein
MRIKPRDKRALLTGMSMWLMLFVLVTLTGCANLKQSAQSSVAADAATTVVGVASGIAAEANPLIAGPAGLIASVGLRLLVINEIDKLPEAERVKPLAQMSSLTWGIAASNLAVIAAGSNPVGLVIGLIAGYSVWKSTEDERLIAQNCAVLRRDAPELVCELKPRPTQ